MFRSWLLAIALLGSATGFARPGKVLVVLSGVDYVSLQAGDKHPTGYFLTELATPLKALLDAGYQVEFATPGGNTPVMDKVSDDARWFGGSSEALDEARRLVESQKGMVKPLVLGTLSTRKLAQYKGVFLPGGHAPMEDLYRDRDLGRVLRYFHKAKKPTALICHAPIALLSARTARGWIYSGYKMTVFSTAEERQEEDAGHLGGYLNFYVAEALSRAGGLVSVAAPWTSNVVRDRELITGQNPMSDKAFAKALVEALAQ
jgi:putative intracellular protease/amidase